MSAEVLNCEGHLLCYLKSYSLTYIMSLYVSQLDAWCFLGNCIQLTGWTANSSV